MNSARDDAICHRASRNPPSPLYLVCGKEVVLSSHPNMPTPDTPAPTPNRPIGPATTGIAAALLLVGLLGHVLAARAMGGSRIAYVHHVLGFFIIAVPTGLLLLGLARLFWRGRHGVTLLAFAAVQALLGLAVYVGQLQSH